MVQHFSCGLNVDFSSESQISKYIVEVFNDVFAHQLGTIKDRFKGQPERKSDVSGWRKFLMTKTEKFFESQLDF